ncbi:MAG: Uma2 family endonuclease [Planctomycetaceae bacterium]
MLMTVEEFLDERYELPEGGQWSELEGGKAICFQPPDLDHGTVVLNLSKGVSRWAVAEERGYACFDLGLVLRRDPDTVRFPAASFFLTGDRFAESDRDVTETRPAAVVELASTADRRKVMSSRVSEYLEQGVEAVIVVDPKHETVSVWHSGAAALELGLGDRLEGLATLPGFEIEVVELFAVPEWWQRPGARSGV